MDKRDSTITLKSSNQKDSNIVKIAVEMSGQVPQLAKFDQKQPLTGIIQVNKSTVKNQNKSICTSIRLKLFFQLVGTL